MNRIETKGLTMRFGEMTALDGATLTLEPQKIYGLLGRNGAGKTTLLNILSNRLYPTEGTVWVDGEKSMDNDRAQGKIFYMGEKSIYPDGTTVKKMFRWTKMFYPDFDTDYAYRLAEKFSLPLKKNYRSLSTGYQTIAKLIVALASGAPYTFFDEPVLGLDANHREFFYREMLTSYSENPRCFVISTHLIEEIADLIEQVIIIKEGRILLDRPADEVRQMGYSVSGKSADVDAFCADKEIIGEESLGSLKSVSVLGKIGNVPPALEASPLDLQRLFIRLTND